MSNKSKCEICGEPMPEGEEMFKYHGYSGRCPKPPLKKVELDPAAQPQPTEPRIAALEAKCADYEAALKDIIDWNEGLGYPRISLYPNQGQCYSAKVAKAALAKHGRTA